MSGKDDKKSKKEYLRDLKNILRAIKSTISYAFQVAPLHTSGLITVTIISSLIPFVSVWVNSRIIDSLIENISEGALISGDLLHLLIFALSLYLVTGLLQTIEIFFDSNLFFDFSREFGHLVDRKFAYLDIEYYENPETSNLITKVRKNYGGRPLNFMTTSFRLFGTLVSLFSAMFILLFYSPKVVLIVLLVTLPRFINNVVFGKRKWGIWDAKGDIRRDWSYTRWKLSSDFSLQELKIFKVRDLLLERVYRLFKNFQDEQIRIENKRNLFLGILDILRALGYALAFWFVLADALRKRITIGDFNFYISTIGRLQSSFIQFFGDLSRIYEDGLFMVDIFGFLDLEEKVISGTVHLGESTKPPLLEYKNVSFKYAGSENLAIKDFNLKVESGEHLAIVGENGAGKTTLIKLLMRFYDVTEGNILVDGVDIRDLDLSDWYDRVGVLFQEFNTYHFDVKTNIGLGDPKRLNDLEGIMEAAKKSGAHDFIEKYDRKYDQILDKTFEGGIRPSWGQWQKVALARAFFKGAPILILDEPTSAIDPKAEFEIFERLFEFTKGKTVIIISHRFSTVRNAERILVLDAGRVVEEGSHEELAKLKDGKYKSAFEMQRKGYV